MTRRTSKVEELLREEISKLIQAELPEQLGLISVTRTFVAPDLRDARIYLSAIIAGNEDKIMKQLEQKRIAFQKTLGRKLQLRNTPRLSFEFDRARFEIDRIEELLEEINRGT